MYIYVFCILFLVSIISSYFKKEHYVGYNNKNQSLNTNIFDNILKQRSKDFKEKIKDIEQKTNKKVTWNRLRNNINDHDRIMFRLRSDKKYREINSINNLINIVKQKYNDSLCKKYIRFYNFDSKNAKMISPRIAELKPITDYNTGVYSETLKQCVHSDPKFVNKFVCPESIVCPNRRKSINPKHILKNYEHICEYTCI